MNLISIFKIFPDQQTCVDHLESLRWPDGSEQPGTWVTVLTGDMGNMFQFLFMLH